MYDAYEIAADTRINKAMQMLKENDNHMCLFLTLMGGGFWRLERTPDAGNDYYTLMEAIYRYHGRCPEDRIDEYYEETFVKFASYMCEEWETTEFLSIAVAEMDNEKNNKSPFRVDMQKVLDIFGERLRNEDTFADAPGIHAAVARYDAYLSENHGLRILK